MNILFLQKNQYYQSFPKDLKWLHKPILCFNFLQTFCLHKATKLFLKCFKTNSYDFFLKIYCKQLKITC